MNFYSRKLAVPEGLFPRETMPAPLAPAPNSPIAGQARNQRVLLRVKTNVHVALNGKQTTLPGVTLSVNHDGALVVLGRSLPADAHVVLENAHTREKVACRIARPVREMAEGFHTAIEFEAPAPDFWKIAFPPANWRADEV